MRTNNMTLETIETFIVRLACGFASAALLLLFVLLVVGFATSSFAQASQPRTFSSPAKLADALFQAAQKETSRLWKPSSEQGKKSLPRATKRKTNSNASSSPRNIRRCIVWSENPTEARFCISARENWPFPIPLVSKNGEWYFDSDHGKQEILFRRIGENEATAIEVCEEFAMAKNASAAKAASDDPITQFAESLASGSTANADNKESSPFHGYYFRIVTNGIRHRRRVATAAKGDGLILLAYPAEYQSSGVKTFVVTWRGIVFEKDLGPSTTTVAPQIKVRPVRAGVRRNEAKHTSSRGAITLVGSSLSPTQHRGEKRRS